MDLKIAIAINNSQNRHQTKIRRNKKGDFILIKEAANHGDIYLYK